jgi:hypothetical protein
VRAHTPITLLLHFWYTTPTPQSKEKLDAWRNLCTITITIAIIVIIAIMTTITTTIIIITITITMNTEKKCWMRGETYVPVALSDTTDTTL